MISYKELISFIGKYKGVKLNKTLLNDIDKATKKVIAINTSKNKIKKIRKAEKELTSYYKRRIDEAQKERLTLNEFEKLQGKIFNKKARDNVKNETERKSRLFRKYTKDFKDLKQEKRFKKVLKERVWATSRLIRDDTTANEVYRYIIGGVSSKIDGFDGKDLKRIQKGIDKRIKDDKSFERIMENQKALLRANMDEIRDEIVGAIAFRWETNVDERVVGNPKGMYPHPTDIYAHGDHWEREGKLYFYPNSSAMRRGFINTQSPSFRSVESLQDGRPAQPYNCLSKGQGIDFCNFPKWIFRTRTRNKSPFIRITLTDTILIVTRDHKILTPSGWVSADTLQKGDYIIKVSHKGTDFSKVNFNDNTIIISDLFDLISKSFNSSTDIKLMQELEIFSTSYTGDFDKDIVGDKNIDIISLERLLDNGVNAFISQCVKNIQFTSAELAISFRAFISRFFSQYSFGTPLFKTSFNTFDSFMSFFSDLKSILFTRISKADDISLTTRADMIAEQFKPLMNSRPINTKIFTHFQNAVASNVSLFKFFYINLFIMSWKSLSVYFDKSLPDFHLNNKHIDSKILANFSNSGAVCKSIVNSVDSVNIDSHIYSLETNLGYYTINSLINKNCRCWSHSVSLLSEVYEYDESLLTKKGIEYLKTHKMI